MTYPQTRASGLPPPVIGAQARPNATTLSVLRDASLFQLNSEKEMDKDIETTKGGH